ncbi:MAG: DUF1553 domain-containing protein [Bacteroidota bacterium]
MPSEHRFFLGMPAGHRFFLGMPAGHPLLLVMLITCMLGCGPGVSENPQILSQLPDHVDFNYHIKPLLSDRCYACHGPDENKREADLRLDTEEGAFALLGKDKDRRAIVSGSLRKSQVYHRITNTDPDEMMPPPESNLSLSEYEIALINKWIDQGAEWKPHWAFIPPQKPVVPKVKQINWVRNSIDHFVLQELERQGITPSKEANKERLLRRVSLDLTGLPPTIEEMDAFLADDSDDAYEKAVDRLIASDAYGERMAMEWLDVARYADSHGLHADGWRRMWPWRDWVIKAFNSNIGFDDFLTWQMAGDMLPNATKDQVLATAFHRNHPMTAEGGVVDEEWRLEYVFDRSVTTARAFMGLTMECAKCHDHKFDPVSQKEFYQMAAFFNNIKELGMTGDDGNYGPCMPLPEEETEQALRDLDDQISQKKQLLHLTKEEVLKTQDWFDKQTFLSTNLNQGLLGHYPLERISAKRMDGRKEAEIGTEAQLVEGKKGKALRVDNEYNLLHIKAKNFEWTDPFSFGLWIHPSQSGVFQTIAGTSGDKNNFWRGWDLFMDSHDRLSVRLIHSLPHDYLQLTTEQEIPTDTWTHIMFSYDGLGKGEGMRLFVNGQQAESLIDYDRLTRSIKTVQSGDHKITDRAIRIGKGYRSFTGDNGLYQGMVDDIYLYNRSVTAMEVAEIAGVSNSDGIADHYLATQSKEIQQTQKELRQLYQQRLDLANSVPEIMIMEEMEQPRAMFVLDRGAYDSPTDQVQPDIPTELGAFPEELPANRLGLAQWLLRPEHPLTSRVTMNRYWQLYFGKGLVDTPEDFGSQGSLPSHPELLDWLAISFIESGWDIKAMHKMIVMSATYRQDSYTPPNLLELDPQNIWLARGPRHRLAAEMIRDNVLAASGLLVKTIGGPSVKPYQPEGLWIDLGNFSTKLLRYKQDSGDSLYRRTMYTFIRRTSPPPSMIVFDASTRNTCVVRRQNTNTPLQALVLLNDPQYVEASRILAERMQKEGGEKLIDQLTLGFRLLTGRFPQETEIDLLTEQFETELAKYTKAPTEAKNLMNIGEKPFDESLNLSATAALTMVASTMMNLDEAYTKR